MRELELFIDYKSPFAYLVVSDAYELERDYDVRVIWKPYTLIIPSFMGSVEERSPHQWRRVRYSYADARRLANRKGLIVKGPKRIFDSRPAHVGMLYAQERGVFRAYNDLVFKKFWNRELDIEDVSAVTAQLTEAGTDATDFVSYLAGRGGKLHDEIQMDAEDRGVFGVPMFILDGEMFWGGDRLYLVKEKLQQRANTR